MDDLGRVVVELERPEERHEEEPYEPLVEATVYLCYLLIVASVLVVVVYEAAKLVGG
jgi:hypothetical protein